MTDHELLELAAKAAGIKAQFSNNYGDFSIGEPYSHGEIRWNPLTDDGDALRLACALRIGITQRVEEVRVANRHISAIYESVVDDRAAATRRAIVMAAAETFSKIGQYS